MWGLLGLVAVFWIAIALSVKIWYENKPADIPYKFFNVCWVICLVYTFIRGWLFFVALGCFWIAYVIKLCCKDEGEEHIYWPLKHKW